MSEYPVKLYPRHGSVDYVARGLARRAGTPLAQARILAVDIDSTILDANATHLETAGFHTLDKGGALYYKWTGAPLPAWGQNVWWFVTANNITLRISHEQEIESDMFGTFGDAVWGFAAAAPSAGTDVTTILNKLTLYAETYGQRIYLSEGAHLISDVVHVGRGLNFQSIEWFGKKGSGFSGWGLSPAYPGARIYSTFNDRPAINIQSARRTIVDGITIMGPLVKHINDNNLGRCVGAGPNIIDTDQAAWLPGSGPHTNGQYNAGCGIAVDAYSGARPGTSYPDPVYLSHETVPLWNRPLSSEVTIRNCSIQGFSVGVLISPTLLGLQGDFVEMPNLSCWYCINAISVGNSQSRGLVTDNLKWVFCHTVLTSNKHGALQGYIAGSHKNWSGGQQICLLDYSPAFSASVSIDVGYFEGGWRLANIVGVGPPLILNFRAGITLDAGSSAVRGRPWNHIGVSNTNHNFNSTPVRLTGDVSVESLFIANCLNIVIDGQILPTERPVGAGSGGSAPPAIERYISMAHNTLAGGWAVPRVRGVSRHSCTVKSMFGVANVDTGVVGSIQSFDGDVFEAPTSTTGISTYTKRVRPAQHFKPFELIPNYDFLGSSSWTPSLSGRVLTMTGVGLQTLRERFNLNVGDVFRFRTNGMWGFIASFDPANGSWIGKVQNGFLDTAGVITWPTGTPVLTGDTIDFYSGRYYCPDNVLFGDFTSGNTTIANMTDLNGTTNFTGIRTGDGLYVDLPTDGPYANDLATCAAPSGTTMVMSSAGSLTTSRKRIIMRRFGITANPTP